jgi:hypothetical protein
MANFAAAASSPILSIAYTVTNSKIDNVFFPFGFLFGSGFGNENDVAPCGSPFATCI